MSLTRFAPAPLLAVAVALSSAAAQDSTSCTCTTVQPSKPPSEFELRSSGTITFIQSRPQGGLGANIPRGYGVDGAYFFRLDQRGAFSLRFGAGIVDYGHEAQHVPLSPTIGRVQVKVKTTNYLSQLTIGPQFMWPRGLIRPYVNAGIGTQVFFTESSVEGVDSDDSSDLSTMYKATYEPEVYRRVHRLVHHEFRARKSANALTALARSPWQIRPAHARRAASFVYNTIALAMTRQQLRPLRGGA